MSLNINAIGEDTLSAIKVGYVELKTNVGGNRFTASQRLNGKDPSVTFNGTIGPLGVSCKSAKRRPEITFKSAAKDGRPLDVTCKVGPGKRTELSLVSNTDARKVSFNCKSTGDAGFEVTLPVRLMLPLERVSHKVSSEVTYNWKEGVLSGKIADKFALEHLQAEYVVTFKGLTVSLDMKCTTKWFDVNVSESAKNAVHALCAKSDWGSLSIETTMNEERRLQFCKLGGILRLGGLSVGVVREIMKGDILAKGEFKKKLKWGDVSVAASFEERMCDWGAFAGAKFWSPNGSLQVLANSDMELQAKATKTVFDGVKVGLVGSVNAEMKRRYGFAVHFKD